MFDLVKTFAKAEQSKPPEQASKIEIRIYCPSIAILKELGERVKTIR